MSNSRIVYFNSSYENFVIKDNDDRVKENNYRKLYHELIKFREIKQYDVNDDESIERQSITTTETKTKTFLEETMLMYNNNYNYNDNYSSKSPISQKYTKTNISENVNMIDSPHFIHGVNTIDLNNSKQYSKRQSNKIINCDNNISNFYFNNININSAITDQSKKATNKILNSVSTIKSTNTINQMKNMNNLPSSHQTSPFIMENFTSRYAKGNTFDFMRKSNIANMKQNPIPSQKTDRSKFSERHKDSIDTTSNLNLNLHMNVNDTYRNADNKSRKIPLRDCSSIQISPLKRFNINNFIMNQSNNSHNISQCSETNQTSVKNIEFLPKLAGDDDVDLFSDNEK